MPEPGSPCSLCEFRAGKWLAVKGGRRWLCPQCLYQLDPVRYDRLERQGRL